MYSLTNKNQKYLTQTFHIKRLIDFTLKPKVYGLTFASLVITCVFIPPIVTSRNLVNGNQINYFVNLSIIDDI